MYKKLPNESIMKVLIISPDWQVRWHHRLHPSHSSACWRELTTREHTEQRAIVDFGFVCATAGCCRRSYIHVGRRYTVIIGPGRQWFHELQRS